AKAVATLDRLTDGRAELAIGAGAFWDGIAGMGGPRRAPAEAVAATAEALEILRDAFAGTGRVVSRGDHHPVAGCLAVPPPAHDIRLWACESTLAPCLITVRHFNSDSPADRSTCRRLGQSAEHLHPTR